MSCFDFSDTPHSLDHTLIEPDCSAVVFLSLSSAVITNVRITTVHSQLSWLLVRQKAVGRNGPILETECYTDLGQGSHS